MPSQSGEVEEISAACGGKKNSEEKESLQNFLHKLFLIYLWGGINGFSLRKILLKDKFIWSIMGNEGGGRDDDFEEVEGLF